MLSANARRKLMKQMDEPMRSYRVLAKCAAGLIVVVLLALAGANEPVSPGAAGNVAGGAPVPAYLSPATLRK